MPLTVLSGLVPRVDMGFTEEYAIFLTEVAADIEKKMAKAFLSLDHPESVPLQLGAELLAHGRTIEVAGKPICAAGLTDASVSLKDLKLGLTHAVTALFNELKASASAAIEEADAVDQVLVAHRAGGLATGALL